MEAMKIADEIEKKIKLLESMRLEIKSRAIRKSIAISEYDKNIAITIIKLKNGETMTLDGEIVCIPQAILIEKIAKGICWKQRAEMEEAEAMYKSLISNIDSVQAELNGYQSINRHLD